jgi:uncharacterized protein
MHNKYAHMIAFILVIIGGLNWGFEALGFNLVNKLVGAWPTVEMIVYLLVGLSAIYLVITHKGTCTMCRGGGSPSSMPM